MQEMEARGFLVGTGKREQFRFAVQFTEKRQAGGSSRTASILEIPDIVGRRLRRIAAAQPVGQNHGRMPREVRNPRPFPPGRRADYIEILEHFSNSIPPPSTPPLRLTHP